MKRIAGLDGLRGIAVLAVVLYHCDLGILNGGFLGVDVFFVLSGFLITTLLINEIEKTGRIDRPTFYIRRIRRILPALAVVILVCIIVTGLWVPDAAYEVRRDLPWALTFVLNWSYIVFEQSYFLNIARPPLFQHMWSLAIEEQFYIVWPLVLIAFSKMKIFREGIRTAIIVVGVIGIALSTGLMWWLSVRHGYPVPHDPSRVYFGTDTHASGLLVGCVLAAMWRSERLNVVLTPDRSTAMNLAGVASLATIIYFFVRSSELTVGLYRYGFLVLSISTAIVIAIIAHPATRIGKALGHKWLRLLGERSYGIYLWHWPIFQLLRPGIDIDVAPLTGLVIRLGLLFVFAEVSYRFIEMPIRQGVISHKLAEFKASGLPRPSLPAVALCLSSVLLLGTSLVGVLTAPSPATTLVSALGGITSIDEDPIAVSEPNPTKVHSVKPVVITKIGKVAIFGDSVVLSGHAALKSTLGRISIDAAVGRQPREIANHIKLRRTQDRLSQDIVIHMGTNGLVTSKDLVPILASLQDRRRVVVVNVQVPRVWMKQTNRAISLIVSRYPNARLANWYQTSKGHKAYFVPDGVHLTPAGGRAFAALIQRTLLEP